MVLGANIFPAKSIEVGELMKSEEVPKNIIQNKLFDEKKEP